MSAKPIRSALISVFHKEGLAPILHQLHELGVQMYSTGGTESFILEQELPVTAVETLTTYPSILDGRVKTLHPKIHAGILARRTPDHLAQLAYYDIPAIDLIIVDLYPFEQTVATTNDEEQIIEKIDIGGIALIRAAAKNFEEVVIVPSREDYRFLQQTLASKGASTDLADRRHLARRAFAVSSHYDAAIFNYFDRDAEMPTAFKRSEMSSQVLRYGENPHQKANFYGNFEALFTKLNGKEISYNNLVDIDAAVGIMAEFENGPAAFCILKHTNACGVAVRDNLLQAWEDALACDSTSAFGGILIANRPIDLETAQAVDQIFYEVLIAPAFEPAALDLLAKKKNRVLLQYHSLQLPANSFKSLLNGVVQQQTDHQTETAEYFTQVTQNAPTAQEVVDLVFAAKCAKHLKSNTIVLAKNQQLIGMGCGQTSRVDALQQAILKAKQFGFSLDGAVMASDAFFPFPDCVEMADQAGIRAVVQPGGSVKDQESIDYCNQHGLAMVTTGIRHFKH